MIDENWDEASNIIDKLIEKGGSVKIESLWNLTLINLKTENNAECRSFLTELLETKDPTYRKVAKTLLKRIKKMVSIDNFLTTLVSLHTYLP